MSPKAQVVFYGLACVLFLIAALWGVRLRRTTGDAAPTVGIDIVPLGLALWVFVAFFNAWKAI